MKTSITKSFFFEAAHQLKNHDGKCANLHGHSYRFDVTVAGSLITNGSSEGMVIDFADLSKKVNDEIIEKWDHPFLNDLVTFPTTAELLAKEIFSKLKDSGLNVIKVCLWETSKSYATVQE